ncbi:Inner membrane protein involved in colicin E2 resistance [Opitutaceae bacterium TAV1]|nr:Inner membrane protein involved in colicin E2 resistance [Opitutaceae bacterium TAV1]
MLAGMDTPPLPDPSPSASRPTSPVPSASSSGAVPPLPTPAGTGGGASASSSAAHPVIAGICGWLRRRSLFFRILGAGLVGLLLLIPLAMVHSTLEERQARHSEAVGEIMDTWGRSQEIAGPVLVVPYSWKTDGEEVHFVNGKRQTGSVEKTAHGEAWFLPETLAIEGQLDPSLRKRSIYTAAVYSTHLRVSGRFAVPDFGFVRERDVTPHWEKARLCFMISDLRGARENLVVKWGGRGADDTGGNAISTTSGNGGGNTGDSPAAVALPLQPGPGVEGMASGVHAAVTAPSAATGPQAFSLDLRLNGSGRIDFVPLGRQTQVRLASAWPDPGFSGAWLPMTREVGADGFSAEWQVSWYGRNFPENGLLSGARDLPGLPGWSDSAFGVELLQPLNAYRVTERAIKYGVLFITLVFTTFFIFEAACGVRLSALNYLLVGTALCLFYLGTLALAEFVAFGIAYGLAAAASTLLIACYSRRILDSGRRAWIVGGLLGGVYGYLYFVLRMEDFSLLAGTAALFVVLGAIMYVTRKPGLGRASDREVTAAGNND